MLVYHYSCSDRNRRIQFRKRMVRPLLKILQTNVDTFLAHNHWSVVIPEPNLALLQCDDIMLIQKCITGRSRRSNRINLIASKER